MRLKYIAPVLGNTAGLADCSRQDGPTFFFPCAKNSFPVGLYGELLAIFIFINTQKLLYSICSNINDTEMFTNYDTVTY